MINENEEVIIPPPEETPLDDLGAENESVSDDDTDSAINTEDAPEESPDYAEILEADMNELSEEFSPGAQIKITDLRNPIRYGALRDLGLTPKEAYLASGGKKEKANNRAHLSSSVPRKISASFSEMPRAELDAARELFSDMSDSEIRNLYRKVTK